MQKQFRTTQPPANSTQAKSEAILPNRMQEVFLGQAAGNQKFFGAAVFQKCCRGVGEQPTFAEQIVFCNLFSLLQLHFLKLANSQLAALSETSYKFE